MTQDDSGSTTPNFEVGTGATPYENVDLSALPGWWREAIEEFRDHDLRPFKPPRFSDGELKFRTVERLENELDINIDFVGVDVTRSDDWTVRVNKKIIGTIGRRRTSEAYTEFEMPSDEFEEWIRKWLAESD